MTYPMLIADGEQLFSMFCTLSVLSMLVERALAVLFENKVISDWLSKNPIKELIAVGVSLGVCMRWNIDVITPLAEGPEARPDSFWGAFITACIIAGGSKASLKLFHDVLGVVNKPLPLEGSPLPSTPQLPATPQP